MPDMVTAGSPVDWLLRRPDVRAAERRLAAATAGIGVEMAEFYPKLELSGSFGWTAQQSGQIGDRDAERWRSVPALSWRILDFGRVRQRVLAARAQAAGALAAYDEVWLLAIEETENALANYQAMSERVTALERAHDEIRTASELAKLRYAAGSDNYLSVLDADRSRIELADQLIQARTDRATALAALYKALGGDFTRLAPAD
jgi:multidrug efflux system outer membrane protein